MRIALLIGLAVLMTGCAGSASDEGSRPRAFSTMMPPDSHSTPDTELSAATVAFLRAWAANDVPTMVDNSAPGSPARAYAEYWGDVYDAGRLDSGPAELALARRSAVLTYGDGSAYRMTDFIDDHGLVTWTAQPGGPLQPRIVAGPPVSKLVGGIRVTALRQYVNAASDLRVSLRLRNTEVSRRDIETPSYVSPHGRRSPAALGSGGRTGVVRTAAGSRSAALVSATSAAPGGRLWVRVYDPTGRPQGRTVLALPQ